MAARRTPQERQEILDEAMERLAQGVASLRAGEGWQAWLDTAARFHHYSVNNQLLILMQKPDASMVAGFRTWQELGRNVMKGERSIRILAPSTRKVEITDEAGAPRLDDNGNPLKRDKLMGFRAVPVFDISQTDGEPIPEGPKATLLQGQAPAGLWDGLAAQVQSDGYALSRAPGAVDIGGANGVTNFAARTVQVRADVSDAQAAKTLAHELGHVRLHDPAAGEETLFVCRGTAEVEAESVAYLVSAHAGLDTSDYSFGYVAGWAATTSDDVLMATANRVRATAAAIIEQLPEPPPGIPEPPQLTWSPVHASAYLDAPLVRGSVLTR